jgi:hypothetical protein
VSRGFIDLDDRIVDTMRLSFDSPMVTVEQVIAALGEPDYVDIGHGMTAHPKYKQINTGGCIVWEEVKDAGVTASPTKRRTNQWAGRIVPYDKRCTAAVASADDVAGGREGDESARSG